MKVPLAVVTLVCESWGSDPPVTTIPCREAAGFALAALGPGRAGRVERIDVGFGERCATSPSCSNRRPDVVWVLAHSVGGDVELVNVARGQTGHLEVWPPVASAAAATPGFDPPVRAAPALGADAPIALRDRDAYPFCGDEDLGQSENFAVAARRCFVDGLLAGSPVELISRSVSTEGDPVLTLFRFGGRGSVMRSVHAGGRWTTGICAIEPIPTAAAFVIAGGCDPA